jgi:hypothetical protein
MGTFLLHNPWVQFYLLYVGALLAIIVWDRLRDARATRDDSLAPPALVETLLGQCRGRRHGRIRK